MKNNFKIAKNNFYETAITTRNHKDRDHRIHTPVVLDSRFCLRAAAGNKFSGKLMENKTATTEFFKPDHWDIRLLCNKSFASSLVPGKRTQLWKILPLN